MTALILVVDDIDANRKLLEDLLNQEYYDVITAVDGFGAIRETNEKKPDIVLLDVMMPGMDGFEACRQIKSNPETTHIPVVMVTALSEKADRIKGLESGADDFLTKPIRKTQLLARVKSLARLKVLLDELRLRDQTGNQMGLLEPSHNPLTMDLTGAEVLVVDDDVVQSKQIMNKLSENYKVTLLQDASQTVEKALAGDYDLLLISTQLMDADGLRICSQIRSHEKIRNLPVLIVIDGDDEHTLVKGLELGANDYITAPVDANELLARTRSQIRRKFYQDALKDNVKRSISMAITDNLTGLYNRHYLNAHMENLFKEAVQLGKPMSFLILDMDHFKSVNDTYGHDVGDEVLVELAKRINQSIRGSDLAARLGGEEFVVVMPGTPGGGAKEVAERLRRAVETVPFKISHPEGAITKTISVGVSTVTGADDTVHNLIKRADEAVYKAKNSGRNQVVCSYEVS